MSNESLTRSFARDLKARNLAPRTVDTYLAAIAALTRWEPGVDLEDTSVDELRGFLAAQAELSAGSAANRFRALQQFYKWAVEEGIIGVSPMKGMSPPIVPEVPVDMLSLDDIKALLRACAGTGFPARRDAAMIRLFLEPGGLRVSEMVGLAVADVDFRQDIAVVMGKGRRPRAIPFGSRTGQALERYLRSRDRHKHSARLELWLGDRGPMTRSGVGQMLERRAVEAGIGHVHPHMLRHTSAHEWLAAGGQEADALALFGWRSRQMVQRYGASGAVERAKASARRLSLGDRY